MELCFGSGSDGMHFLDYYDLLALLLETKEMEWGLVIYHLPQTAEVIGQLSPSSIKVQRVGTPPFTFWKGAASYRKRQRTTKIVGLQKVGVAQDGKSKVTSKTMKVQKVPMLDNMLDDEDLEAEVDLASIFSGVFSIPNQGNDNGKKSGVDSDKDGLNQDQEPDKLLDNSSDLELGSDDSDDSLGSSDSDYTPSIRPMKSDGEGSQAQAEKHFEDEIINELQFLDGERDEKADGTGDGDTATDLPAPVIPVADPLVAPPPRTHHDGLLVKSADGTTVGIIKHKPERNDL